MQPKEDALEKLRAAMVGAMRNGHFFAIDCGAVQIDWSDEFSCDIFKTSEIFDYEHFDKSENYLKYVKQEEKYTIGGLNKNFFNKSEDFTIVIVSSGTDETI